MINADAKSTYTVMWVPRTKVYVERQKRRGAMQYVAPWMSYYVTPRFPSPNLVSRARHCMRAPLPHMQLS